MSTVATALRSRRRAALLAGQVEPPPPTTRLSLEDVERLRTDGSPEARIGIAGKLGRQYDELAADDTRPLAEAVLDLLVKDVEKKVRQTLAEAVASSRSLPEGVALRLAWDEIEVARPILEASPVLGDDQLIEIVRTHTMQYALAVAGRQSLSTRLSAALVDTGESVVVARIVDNRTAQLSSDTLKRIAEDYALEQDIQDRLVRRPELPYELVDQLVGMIGQRLQWELVKTRQVGGEDAKQLIAAVRERATIDITAREHDQRQVLVELKQEHLDGRLDQVAALCALRDGRISRFEGIMALLADIDLARVRRLLYGMDKRGTAAICIEAGFGAPHYIAVRMALDLAEQGVTRMAHQTTYTEEALRFIQHQYARMQTQPELVRQLVDSG